jgi:uncharacterized protein YbcC (UPF0753/DUF2309 family)
VELHRILDDLRVYLPIQNPLGVFIHNNMLLHFEDRPFAEGVAEAARLFGARQTMDEGYYAARAPRIRKAHLRAELDRWATQRTLPVSWAGRSREAILWDLLHHPLVVPQRSALNNQRAGHRRALALARGLRPPTPSTHLYSGGKAWKHAIARATGEDVNEHFFPVLIRFLAAYVDQGMATWHHPHTNEGLWDGFRAFIVSNAALGPSWMRRLRESWPAASPAELETWLAHWLTRLPHLGEPRVYLQQTLLELRGWAGLLNKLETEPTLVPRYAPKVRLLEYVAIFLLLEDAVHRDLLARHKLRREAFEPPGVAPLTEEQLAHTLAHALAATGLDIEAFEDAGLQSFADLAVAFDGHERALVWHRAFDLSMRDDCLDALHGAQKRGAAAVPALEARVYCCIDDREESFRRHIEEINPRLDTQGVVGFFGLDMKFRSAFHPEPVIHCPPVVTPSRVVDELAATVQVKRGRRTWGKGQSGVWYGTRAGLGSYFFTFLTGPGTSMVLFLRIFFPRLAQRAGAWLRARVVPPLATHIYYDAAEGQGGYSLPEMAGIVATILRFAGTKEHFPRLQYFLSHGSTSMNNPYRNAYGCGACSGRAGIPNAKIFCAMANRPDVREELRRAHGIDVPAQSFFVAGYHDTATDEVRVLNEDAIPPDLRADHQRIIGQIREAAGRNSLERCRNFSSARAMRRPAATIRHVADRGASLAEPRPEYGHTNNLMCVIGQRTLTRDLFLDRRAFLASYDAGTDPEGIVLAQVMAGAVPVAGGINLDYYFSRIDNEVYGSGTKLPLNVVGLLGVMTGSTSDLRIGLAQQMVELHEPARTTIVIQARPEIVQRILDAAPRQRRLVHNGWIHMALVHPETGETWLHNGVEFVRHAAAAASLVEVRDQRAYASHRRGPLPFAYLTGGQG